MRARRRSHGMARPLREGERLVEERDRGRDARDAVAAAAEAEEHVGPVDVREARELDRARARAGAPRSRRGRGPSPGATSPRPRAPAPRARPSRARRARRVPDGRARPPRRRGASSASASARVSSASTRVRSSTETPWSRNCASTAEPLRQPGDRLVGRARLPALDLADVLLREAIAGQRGLRQAGGDAQRADAFADAPGASRSSDGARGGRIAHTVCTQPCGFAGRRPPMG